MYLLFFLLEILETVELTKEVEQNEPEIKQEETKKKEKEIYTKQRSDEI